MTRTCWTLTQIGIEMLLRIDADVVAGRADEPYCGMGHIMLTYTLYAQLAL